MEKRDHTRIYGLLRRLGHTGTEDEIAERIVAAARGGGVRADGVAENYPCSAPRGSAEWRENRAQVVSIIVGCIVRLGRAACVMPDAGGVPCEPDGDGAA